MIVDEELIAEFNDDPSPASLALIEIIASAHARQLGAWSTPGAIAGFRRELRVKSYTLDGWKTYARSLMVPRASVVSGPPGDRIVRLLEEFRDACDPLLFNNLVLAHEVARGRPIGYAIGTLAEEMRDALADLAAGRTDRATFVEAFGHHAARPYELSDPRFHELDDDALARIAALAGDREPAPKGRLQERLAARESAAPDVLIAVRELARSRMLLVIDDLRTALLDSGIGDVFDLPIERSLAMMR